MRDLRDKLSAIQLSRIETNSRIARNIWSAPAIITDETAIMQTTSVANSNPAAVPAWTDGFRRRGHGSGRTGPVPSGAERCRARIWSG